ncbi:hypothetical protein [Pseudoclavibacter terrae]|uniref:hypothetical protein n=1 Tax=Pseudoclavibacter terrae TaxID=1530195 RepID=UPI00232F82C2|nr:hypothetical protein [Pseudoclavibacter terrae]
MNATSRYKRGAMAVATSLAVGAAALLTGCTAVQSSTSSPPAATLVGEYTVTPTAALTREEAVSKCVAAIKEQYRGSVPGDDSGTSAFDRLFGSLEPEAHEDGANWVVSYSGQEALRVECRTQGTEVKVDLPGS